MQRVTKLRIFGGQKKEVEKGMLAPPPAARRQKNEELTPLTFELLSWKHQVQSTISRNTHFSDIRDLRVGNLKSIVPLAFK